MVIGIVVFLLVPLVVSAKKKVEGDFLIRSWVPGQTITYRNRYIENGTILRTELRKYSILEKIENKNQTLLWVERFSQNDNALPHIQKILVSQPVGLNIMSVIVGDLRFFHFPKRLIDQIGTDSPVESKVSASSKNRKDDVVVRGGQRLYKNFKATRNISITVEAGTFNSTLFEEFLNSKPDNSSFQGEFTRIWASQEIPIWGVLKIELKRILFAGEENQSVFVYESELVDYSEEGAEPMIVQTPTFLDLKQQFEMFQQFKESLK